MQGFVSIKELIEVIGKSEKRIEVMTLGNHRYTLKPECLDYIDPNELLCQLRLLASEQTNDK